MSSINVLNFIPIVDFGLAGLYHEEISEENWKRIANEITIAFEKVGFVYLTKHGIPDEKIRKLFEASVKFFDRPQQEKNNYSWDKETYCGYVPVNKEKLHSIGVNELKETFNIKRPDDPFPDESVPEFRGLMKEILESCQTLANRLLIAMALGLDIKRSIFTDAHSRLFEEGNRTALRMINYPPTHHKDILPCSTRCGPHTDYGTITLLFQDDISGLQVRGRCGNWVNADPIPGTLLVNIGDLMEFWTSGRFTATEHQVIIPEEENRSRKCRQSIAFFLNPEDEVIISPLDGSFQFEPVSCEEYLTKRIKQSYADP